MNTKGMKFLAVLAVLAMAFAAFAVIAPAETDDADSTNVPAPTEGVSTITSSAAADYYVQAEVSQVIVNVAGNADNHAVNFYVPVNRTVTFVMTSLGESNELVVKVYATEAVSAGAVDASTVYLTLEAGDEIEVTTGNSKAYLQTDVFADATYNVGQLVSDEYRYFGEAQSTTASTSQTWFYEDNCIKVNGASLALTNDATNLTTTLTADFTGSLEVVSGTFVVTGGGYTFGDGTAATTITIDAGATLKDKTSAADLESNVTMNLYGTYELTQETNSEASINVFDGGLFTVGGDSSGANLNNNGVIYFESVNSIPLAALKTPGKIYFGLSTDSKKVDISELLVYDTTTDPTGDVEVGGTGNENKITVYTVAPLTHAATFTIKSGGVIFAGNTTSVDYTFKDAAGNNIIAGTDLTGAFSVSLGSMRIDGVTGGDIVITGEAKLKTADISGALNFTTASDSARLTILDGTNVSGTLGIGNKIIVSSDAVIGNSGTISFGTEEGAFIDGSLTTSNTSGKIVGILAGGVLSVDGTLENGDTDELVINKGAKLLVLKTAEVTTGAFGNYEIINNGIINLYGDMSGARVQNDNIINVLYRGAVLPALANYRSAEGTIDTSTIVGTAYLDEEYVSSGTVFSRDQKVVVSVDTDMEAGSDLVINGMLVIDEGVTLTIKDGAWLLVEGVGSKLINNGTIIIQTQTTGESAHPLAVANGYTTPFGFNAISCAEIYNYGTIETAGAVQTAAPIIYVGDGTYNVQVGNYGLIQVINNDEISILAAAALRNYEGATINMYGYIASAGILANGGTINLEGYAASAVTINMLNVGAVVNVVSYDVNTEQDLTVNDSGLIYSGYPVTSPSSVTLGFNDATTTYTRVTLEGVTLTASATYTTSLSNAIVLSGAMSVGTNQSGDGVAKALITLAGKTKVTDSFVVGTNVGVLFGGTLTVSGEMDFAYDALTSTAGASSVLSVTGLVKSSGKDLSNIANLTIKAAAYKLGTSPTVYYYTTVPDAVDAAVANSLRSIDILGDVTVKKNVTIPSTLTVNVKNNAKVTIDKDAEVDVEANGKISTTAGTIIDVDGTLYIAKKSNGLQGGATVEAEVISEGTVDRMYTNLIKALANSEAGDVITLNNATTITTPTVIPAGVTLDMAGNAFTVSGTSLTINGELVVDGTYKVENTVDEDTSVTNEGIVILNGYMTSDSPMTFNPAADPMKYPAGAYYTTGNMAIYVITTIPNAADDLSIADEQTVRIYGTNTITDVTFAGTSSAPATIELRGDLTAGTITLENATFSIASDVTVNGTIASSVGSVKMVDVKAASSSHITAGEAFTVDGEFTEGTGTATYGLTLAGDVALTKFNTTAKGVTINGTATVTDTKVYLGAVTVNGTLVVDNSCSATTANLTVLGSVVVKEATTSKSAGVLTVTGDYMLVGLKKSELADGTTVNFFPLAADASVTGAVMFSKSPVVMAVLNGATVSSNIYDLVPYSTKLVVESKDWCTLYSNVENTRVNVPTIPITDGAFNTWATKADGTGKNAINQALPANPSFNIDIGRNAAIYAAITYEVYEIVIYADNGVGSISIDGKVMAKAGVAGSAETNYAANVFTSIVDIKSGEHQIKWTLNDGYEGTLSLTDADGKKISNTSETTAMIVLDKCTVLNTQVIYTLDGAQQIIPEPITPEEQSEWTITTILLVILVILIAIMAVIVALRLNRS